MNTLEFVFGQLLSFETMQAMKSRPAQRFFGNGPREITQKERNVANNFLFIALLIVGLIANITVMTAPER